MGQHTTDRHKVILSGSSAGAGERPAFGGWMWLIIRWKRWKADSLQPFQTLCDFSTHALPSSTFSFFFFFVIPPPWRRSIARSLDLLHPNLPKSSSAKDGIRDCKKWAGFHTPVLGIRNDLWYWNSFNGIHTAVAVSTCGGRETRTANTSTTRLP